MFCNKVISFQVRYTICLLLRFCSDCSIRVSQFTCKLQLLNFYKANPAPFMLEYNLQPVVTNFISIALIMMMTIGLNSSVLPR